MKSIDEILKDDHVTKVIGKGIDGAMFLEDENNLYFGYENLQRGKE